MQHRHQHTTDQWESISPSAWGTAYQRTLTDIPLSAEIFALLDAKIRNNRSEADIAEVEEWHYPLLTPMFEARYKLLDLLLREHGSKQILEIAAGYSPRGIVMTGDPTVTYIEMDLPDVIKRKRWIVDALIGASLITPRDGLHAEWGNGLSQADLSRVTEWFGDGPVCIIHEGLLRYLPHQQKAIVAGNIRRILEARGGTWMTPDVCARGMNATGSLKAIVREQNERMRALTGIDVRGNYFKDESEAHAFFTSMGFSIERRPFTEVSASLVSPEREKISPELLSDAIGSSAVYVMKTI